MRDTLRAGGAAMVIVLGLITIAEGLERAAGSVLAPDIQDTLNMSDTTLIGISAFGGVALVLGAVPLAWLADRMSRVRIVWIATIGWAIATALNGLVVNPFHLFCTRVGIGFGQAYSVPVFASLLTDTYPIQGRARVFALYWMSQPIGLLLGPVRRRRHRRHGRRHRGVAVDVHHPRDPAGAPRDPRVRAAARARARSLRAGDRARRGADTVGGAHRAAGVDVDRVPRGSRRSRPSITSAPASGSSGSRWSPSRCSSACCSRTPTATARTRAGGCSR